jgi:DNA-binding IclR family transcriptional regulator
MFNHMSDSSAASVTPKGLVKSAVRVIEIFELFEAERRPLKISEIVDRLRVPQSSISTLMKTLIAQGFMDFDPEARQFRPSARLAFLGHWALGAPDSIEQVQFVMRRLADETGESVLLGAQNGLMMQYLSVIESPQALRFSLRPGLMRPIHKAGLGIMLMTVKSDAEMGRLLRRYNLEHGQEGTYAVESEVRAMVTKARKDGWFRTESLMTQGAGVIATLLPLPVRGRYLGLGIGGPNARLGERLEELRGALLAAAKGFAAAVDR